MELLWPGDPGRIEQHRKLVLDLKSLYGASQVDGDTLPKWLNSEASAAVLEVHFINSLTQGGELTRRNMVVLTPALHALVHLDAGAVIDVAGRVLKLPRFGVEATLRVEPNHDVGAHDNRDQRKTTYGDARPGIDHGAAPGRRDLPSGALVTYYSFMYYSPPSSAMKEAHNPKFDCSRCEGRARLAGTCGFEGNFARSVLRVPPGADSSERARRGAQQDRPTADRAHS